jgi:hypothetical protein
MQQAGVREELVISGLDRSEGGEENNMFQFHGATVWGNQRAVATGTGEVVAFVWADIDGVDENGDERCLMVRLTVEDAEALAAAVQKTVAGLGADATDGTDEVMA